MTQPFLKTLALLAALSLAGCTMKSQETPSLSGPSEYGTSIAIAIAPDVLTQDGASQSLISITARDGSGAALRNVSLRAEIIVGGVRADFGSLSARNMVTGNDGRASVVYTAPASPAIGVDNGTIVDIQITPVGSDFNNSSSRTAAIRLVPPGIIVPPDGLRPAFTYTPLAPTDHQAVLFDATSSTSGPGNAITRYTWDFGDGRTGSGPTTSHAYDTAGSYVVTLTISDGVGRSAQKTSNILVAAGLDPTASFTTSPTDALVGQPVNFNASASRAAPGFSIVGYEWNFGDGTTGAGITASHQYSAAGTYIATLKTTDSAGHDATSTAPVTVGSANPTATFTFSPTDPSTTTPVNFNASASRAVAGQSITEYFWSFGNGKTATTAVPPPQTYAAPGNYVVVLTVKDTAGNFGTTSLPVTVK